MPINIDLSDLQLPSSGWLYNRLKDSDPNISPDFASLGTASWMRALAILSETDEFSRSRLQQRYSKVKRRSPIQISADTIVFASAFMAFQNLSAISVMCGTSQSSDLVRSAIVAWYYGIYHAASAMIAAMDGSVQETHSNTAKSWDRQIVQNNLIPPPFNYRFSTLVKKDYETEYNSLRGTNEFTLPNRPYNDQEALGAHLSYLKGTADHERKLAEDRLLSGQEMKAIGATNYRKKAAQKIRDKRLENRPICFLNAAFRYRGKVHYRDAIFLGYGLEYQEPMHQLITDIYTSLTAFIKAASFFCARRVERGTWDQFVDDIEEDSPLSLSVDVMRV